MLLYSLGVSLRRASALPAPSSTTMTSILSGPLYVSETYVLIRVSHRSSVTRKTCRRGLWMRWRRRGRRERRGWRRRRWS
jgi:hypothetical protein